MKQTDFFARLVCILLLAGCQPASFAAIDLPAAPDSHAPQVIESTPAAPGALPTALPAEPTRLPTPVSSPVPSPTPPAPDGAYCLWPGDTFNTIARAAQVDPGTLAAFNPGAVGQAGETIHLPPGSLLPEAWALPAPAVAGPNDLPFGVSGLYLGSDNRRRQVALTFDIGYVPENQERMKWLYAAGVRATFFVLGKSVAAHAEIVSQALAYGHAIGNHSWDHLNFLNLSEDEIRAQLAQTESAVQAASTHAGPPAGPPASTRPYFRAPFGAIDARVIAIAAQQGYQIVGWTVDSHDWLEGATGEDVYQQVVRHVCPGSIIIMHDANPANSNALPRIIDYLRRNGYQIVPLDELFGLQKE